jgi:hypothetical protein
LAVLVVWRGATCGSGLVLLHLFGTLLEKLLVEDIVPWLQTSRALYALLWQ